MTEKLLTLDRAADVSGITERTLRRRIAHGELPAIVSPHDRRRKLIRATDLRKLLGEVPLRKAA